MEKFSTTKGYKVWENKMSVECIDYSILLTKVFGEPINASQAFMYLFRRYGFPNEGSDSYKDLCAYTFHTDNKDIIVRWRLYNGDYHHHLCAFAPTDTTIKIENELRKPYQEYWERCKQWAKETKEYLYYDPFSLWNIEGKFFGNKDEEEDIMKFLNENYKGKFIEETWSAFYKWKGAQNEPIMEEYEKIEPAPKYYREDFSCQYDNQLEASEKQHAWILSLPENSFIPPVYFAAMRLFQSWKRYTRIRDVYFNMTCRGITTKIPGRTVGYSHHAGYCISEKIFKKIVKIEEL